MTTEWSSLASDFKLRDAYYVPGSLLSTCHVVIHLIPITSLWGRRSVNDSRKTGDSSQSLYTGEELKLKEAVQLAKVVEPLSTAGGLDAKPSVPRACGLSACRNQLLLWSQASCFWTWSLPFCSCETLSKFLTFSVPQFAHLKHGSSSSVLPHRVTGLKRCLSTY